MCKEHEARIQELEEELSDAKRDLLEANEKIMKLEQENEELKKHLIEFKSKLEKHQSIIERAFKSNRKKRQKRPGAKPGHKAHHRSKPDHIDDVIEVDTCPHCGTNVNGNDIRPRIIEDIKVAKPEVKQYNIHRGWCPKCKKLVYPKPLDVIPHTHFGLGLGLLVTFQSYALALPYNKIGFELETYFGIKISEGELCKITQKLARMFGPEYEKLKREMRDLEIRYIDETGWRINGKNNWLWDFISEKIALYVIDKSRGHKVPKKVLGKDHTGITANDFYSAYNKLGGKQQKCWAHLLRETSKLSKKKNATEEIKQFHKRLKRLYRDATRFIESEHDREEKQTAHDRFRRRLDRIATEQYEDKNCQRLGKRLQKHKGNMFRFVVVEGLDPNNNEAERGIRPNVVKRKISGGNRSDNGALAHAVNMSIIETCKRQDLNFFEFGRKYLQDQIALGSGDTLPNCK